ncbi:hypothetical protein Ancab_035527 [Ancistrocladus abbreviatus]
MEGSQDKIHENHKVCDGAQIILRLLVVVASVIAAWLMLTAKQNIIIYDMSMAAKYSYVPAFKFEGFINIVGAVFGILSLSFNLVACRKSSNPSSNHFILFIHDLVIMSLLLGGSAAASAIGYVGKYGTEQAGWLPICDHFGKFCNRVTASVMLSFASTALFLCLTVISAINSRRIHV